MLRKRKENLLGFKPGYKFRAPRWLLICFILRSDGTMRLSRDVYALTGKSGTGIRDVEGITEVEEFDWNILLNEACIYPKINLTRQFLFAEK
jgi:hypothetical protein